MGETDDRGPEPVSVAGREFIAAVLRIPVVQAAAIRARTPARRRPRRQVGPTAEFGAAED